MCVEQEAHPGLFPAIQFLWRKGLEEFRADLDLSFQSARLPVSPRILDRNQANDGLGAASDDDVLALTGLLDQPGKLGLGFVDGYGLYVSQFILAKAGCFFKQNEQPGDFKQLV